MSIEFRCSSCGSTLRVEDSHRGKMARCPTCQMIVPIPGDADLRETAPLDRPLEETESPPVEPRWLVRTPDGTLYGPARRSELLTWQAERRISPECRLQQVGQAGWVTPESVLGDSSLPAGGVGTVFPERPASYSPTPVEYSSPLRIRRSHNGGLILALAILGLFFFPLSIVAIVVGIQELKGMDRGEIDDAGRGLVRVGVGLGIVGAVLSIFTNCCCCLSIRANGIRGFG